MKEEKLLDALGKIEDEMVLETAPKAATSEPVQKNALHGGEQCEQVHQATQRIRQEREALVQVRCKSLRHIPQQEERPYGFRNQRFAEL